MFTLKIQQMHSNENKNAEYKRELLNTTNKIT